MIKLILFILALVVYLGLEFLRKKYRLEELNKKSKELLERIKKQDEKAIEEVLHIQRVFMNYFLISTIIIIIPIIFVKSFFGSVTYSLEVVNGNSIIKINELYAGEDFAIYINNTFYGFYRATDSSIVLNNVNLTNSKVKVKLSLIKLPFNLPIFNKNWIGPLGTYILFYFLISIIGGLIKRIYKLIYKTKANG